ncbi:MAG: hypothetical protein AAE985_05630 [Thermoplasmataceae archaeon]|jgi:hypothetical protein|nr:MAG: hypothetical protein AMDU2_EPLC00006G0274 [Thermoplasmatales archaeon E-plasma]
MKFYSEKFFIKYLIENNGICLGIDMKNNSYLFLVTKSGFMLKKRPAGDKIVENLNYDVGRVSLFLRNTETGNKRH